MCTAVLRFLCFDGYCVIDLVTRIRVREKGLYMYLRHTWCIEGKLGYLVTSFTAVTRAVALTRH